MDISPPQANPLPQITSSDLSNAMEVASDKVASGNKSSNTSLPSLTKEEKSKSKATKFDEDSKIPTKITATNVHVKGTNVTVTGKVSLPNLSGGGGEISNIKAGDTGGIKPLPTSKKNRDSTSKSTTAKSKSTKESSQSKSEKLKITGNKGGTLGDIETHSTQMALDSLSDLAKAGAEIGEHIADQLGDTLFSFASNPINMNPYTKAFAVGGGILSKTLATGAKTMGVLAIAGLGAVGAAIGIVSHLGNRYRELITKQDATIGATGRWIGGGGSLFRNEQVAEAHLSLGRQTGENVFGRSSMVTQNEMRFASAMGTSISALAETLGGMRKEGSRAMSLSQVRGYAESLGYKNLRQMEFLQLYSQRISREREEGVDKPSGKAFVEFMQGIKGSTDYKSRTAERLGEMGKAGLDSHSPLELMMFSSALNKTGSISEAELSLLDPERRKEFLLEQVKGITGGKSLKRGTGEYDSAYLQLKNMGGLDARTTQSLLEYDFSKKTPKAISGVKVGSVPGAGLANREEGLYLNNTGRQAMELSLKIEQSLMQIVSDHKEEFESTIKGLDYATDTMLGVLKQVDELRKKDEEANKERQKEDALINEVTKTLGDRVEAEALISAQRDEALLRKINASPIYSPMPMGFTPQYTPQMRKEAYEEADKGLTEMNPEQISNKSQQIRNNRDKGFKAIKSILNGLGEAIISILQEMSPRA
jgi:hypothetical protein